MNTPSEELALSIVRRLQGAGHVAYFAGGCVRDRLLSPPRVPKDFDVATAATPDEVMRLFPRGQPVGAAFGVILIREKKKGESPVQVEVATFRSDGVYSDGRHPDTVRFTTAEEDARRRDFTCNGVFFDPVAGTLHDFVGGQADIGARVLRAIGDAEARFREDHLRMLRAVRFAARLEFEIEPATRAAIERHAGEIKAISRERVGEELRMILAHPSRAAAVALLRDTGLLGMIWPVETWPEGAEAAKKIQTQRIGRLPEHCRRAEGLAAIHRDAWLTTHAQIPAENWAATGDRLQEAFALSNDERADFLWLGEKLPALLDRSAWTRAAHKRLLADTRWPQLLALFTAEDGPLTADLAAWVEQLRNDPGGVAPAPFVTGDTLIKMGASPDPRFRGWLEHLYDRQLENEFPTPQAALAAAQDLVKS